MENRRKKDTQLGTPSPSGPENKNKHRDDAKIPSDELEKKVEEEFEEHNMTDHRGYNEPGMDDVPVKKKNINAEKAEGEK